MVDRMACVNCGKDSTARILVREGECSKKIDEVCRGCIPEDDNDGECSECGQDATIGTPRSSSAGVLSQGDPERTRYIERYIYCDKCYIELTTR